MPIDLARTPRALPTLPPDDPELLDAARQLAERPDVQRLIQRVREADPRVVEEQVELARTPAPPFHEADRGRLFARLLVASGSGEPRVDPEGNVLAWLGEPGPDPLILAAHLDTVFPPSQEIAIREVDGEWVGPGICDDARGLAVLLGVARALGELDLPLGYPLLLAGTVGEEGVGNLRGVRHLFGPGGAGEGARGFISLDGAGVNRVIASGVGSRRFRAELRGPGGHSWVDWGRVNPLHALARAVVAFGRIPLPAGCTMSVGRMEGGTSINAIPDRGWMEFETRSEDEGDLAWMEEALTGALHEAVAEENQGAAQGQEAVLELTCIGRRPAGTTPTSTSLLRAAVAATRQVAGRAELAASSTDANLPMSVGVPAVTLGAGGEAGEAHTPQEWYRNENGPEGVLRAVFALLLLEAAGG